MIEKFMLVGYRKVYIVENDPSEYSWVEIVKREFDDFPTDEDKKEFCNDYSLDMVETRKIDIPLFK